MASARSICPYRMPDEADALGQHRGLFEQHDIAGERDAGDRLLVRDSSGIELARQLG
jgi:hypothetical protein